MRLLSLGRAPSPAVSSWRAVAAGNEVTNPCVVTKVYMREGDIWTLGSMSFTPETGKRGGPEPEAVTLEAYGMPIPDAG